MMRKVIFASNTCGPTRPGLINGRALMGCCKCICEQASVFHIGDRRARSSVKQKASKNHAHARTNCKQPACLGGLRHSKRGWCAARIYSGHSRGSAQVHGAVISLKTDNKIFPLEVVASRASSVEAVHVYYLIAGAGDCGRAGGREIAGRTETGAGIHLWPAKSATNICTDVKAFEIVRCICRAKGKKHKRKRTRTL